MSGYPGIATRLWRSSPWTSNPLLRTGDRIRVGVEIIAVMVTLVLIPVSAAVGTARFDTFSGESRERASTGHPVTAVLEAAASAESGPNRPRRYVTWYLDGEFRRATVEVTSNAAVGDQVELWVEDQGVPMEEPRSGPANAFLAIECAVYLWGLCAVITAVLVVTLRRVLMWHRLRDIQREWQWIDNTPGWTVA